MSHLTRESGVSVRENHRWGRVIPLKHYSHHAELRRALREIKNKTSEELQMDEDSATQQAMQLSRLQLIEPDDAELLQMEADSADQQAQQDAEASESVKDGNAEPKAWRKNARALAQFALEYLANRYDAWGQYLPKEERTPKKKVITKKGGLSLETLECHFEGREVGDLCGLHAISLGNKCRWFVIDIDCHDANNEELKTKNRAGAKALYAKAKKAGLKPLLIGSNGRGGYHLWVVFMEPLPSSEVYDLGHRLVADWKQLGLSQQPELFPKQRQLDVATQFGNWIRLPGRHHTHPYWSNVWNGTVWLKGEAAIDAILKTTGIPRPTELGVIGRVSPESSRAEPQVIVNDGYLTHTGDTELDQFVPFLKKVKKTSNGYKARCPCPGHLDETPSFGFKRSDDGKKILFICRAGCSFTKIISAINDLRSAHRDASGVKAANKDGINTSLSAELDRELFNARLRKLNKKFIKALTPELLHELCEKLDIPSKFLRAFIEALRAFDVGWSSKRQCWSFPFRDGDGTIIGITYRPRKGDKFVEDDSNQGLFLPKDWKELTGTVYVPEGLSDAVALYAMGIPVIGRFNNTHGAELLAEVSKHLKCEFVILGDNDSKRDGSWAGLVGVKAVSEKLARLLGRPVKWALPPTDVKDVRSWLISQGGSHE